MSLENFLAEKNENWTIASKKIQVKSSHRKF